MLRTAVKVCLTAACRLERAVARVSSAQRVDVRGSIGDPREVRSLLIWSMDRLGDLVRATPAIRALTERFAGAHVAVVAAGRAGPILRENPRVGSLYQIDNPFHLRDHRRILHQLKGSAWDLGVLLESDPYWAKLGGWWFRHLGLKRWVCFDFGDGVPSRAIGVPLGRSGSWIDQFNRLVAATGAVASDGETEVYLNAAEREWAARFLAAQGVDPARPFFLIHPGGNFLKVSRQWPPKSFAELIRLMRRSWPHPIVITGLERERRVVDAIREHTDAPLVDLCGGLDLRQLAAVLDRSAVCIMNDTGPLHVAHALRKRTVVILGPTCPEVVGIPETAVVVRAKLSCSPCAFLTGWKACANPVEWECLSAVSPEVVFDAVRQQANRPTPSPDR